jgi:hypothetical protein
MKCLSTGYRAYFLFYFVLLYVFSWLLFFRFMDILVNLTVEEVNPALGPVVYGLKK